EEFLTSEGSSTPVFTLREINRMAKFIALGLKRGKPNQDIIFVLETVKPKLLILKDKIFNSGRAFYKDGKLNLIIGDYNFGRNEAFEKTYDPGGQAKLPYFLSHGSRTSHSDSFNEAVVKVPGVENKKANKTRRDWFIIDVKLAAESYIAQLKAKQNPQSDANKKLLEKQAAQLAKERREIRLEMARLRKDMEDKNQGEVSSSSSIELRLEKLKSLKEKGLIDESDYVKRKEEILGEI
ncbi:MAG: SHOCT domain-containing protein, partial [Proteobacteria bacterium]|nr:SHOCT domain-containing protein [Pseudomonadota bacterium]